MDLDAEHEALLRQIERLQREHDELEQQPFDHADHLEHLARLRRKILELRVHMARLKSEAPGTEPSDV